MPESPITSKYLFPGSSSSPKGNKNAIPVSVRPVSVLADLRFFIFFHLFFRDLSLNFSFTGSYDLPGLPKGEPNIDETNSITSPMAQIRHWERMCCNRLKNMLDSSRPRFTAATDSRTRGMATRKSMKLKLRIPPPMTREYAKVVIPMDIRKGLRMCFGKSSPLSPAIFFVFPFLCSFSISSMTFLSPFSSSFLSILSSILSWIISAKSSSPRHSVRF